jgi:hypothetical protein
VFLAAIDHLTISYIFSKCTSQKLGETIMKKLILGSCFVQISAKFKGEIENVNLGKRGGGGRPK